MKKEYKTPMLSKVIMEIESLMMSDSEQGNMPNSKKSGRTFEDEEDIAPAAPKKFWDDEE